jgi:hypothetical protein
METGTGIVLAAMWVAVGAICVTGIIYNTMVAVPVALFAAFVTFAVLCN